jgi:hypothetical protein
MADEKTTRASRDAFLISLEQDWEADGRQVGRADRRTPRSELIGAARHLAIIRHPDLTQPLFRLRDELIQSRLGASCEVGGLFFYCGASWEAEERGCCSFS